MRRDREVKVSAVMPLTHLFLRREVSQWRYLADGRDACRPFLFHGRVDDHLAVVLQEDAEGPEGQVQALERNGDVPSAFQTLQMDPGPSGLNRALRAGDWSVWEQKRDYKAG